MSARQADGSAGDANYGVIGAAYSKYRQPEPRIADLLTRALGDAGKILNVGAGAGSYEPTGRSVTAVEPSAAMRRQRPPGFPEAIDAVAENLPFSDGAFDASMATFTVHQWQNLKAGLREMRRVTRGPIVILTCDPRRVQKFWLNDYAPEVLATEARRYPAMNTMAEALCGSLETLPVPIPLLCRDGFNEAYYGRPEMLLDPAARTSCSAWSFVAEPIETIYVQNLRTALEDGSWDSKHGVLRCSPEYTGSLVLLVSRP